MSLAIQNLNEIKNVSQTLFDMPHYKKLGQEGIFMIVSYAKSIGIDPLEALNGGLYNINGKIGMAAETMARLVRMAGHSISKDAKSNDTVCILHGKRKDNGDTWTSSFSIEEAKKAGIYKGVWEKYPATMCYNRAMSFLFRQLFPDLAKNAGYVQDELEEIAANEKIVSMPTQKQVFVGLDAQEKTDVELIFLEFPEIEKRVLKSIGEGSTLSEVPKGYYPMILKCLEIERKKMPQKTEVEIEEAEIVREFAV